jgi:hypothetical protein
MGTEKMLCKKRQLQLMCGEPDFISRFTIIPALTAAAHQDHLNKNKSYHSKDWA